MHSGFGPAESLFSGRNKNIYIRLYKSCETFISSAGSCHLLCGTRLRVSSSSSSLRSLTHSLTFHGCCSAVDCHSRPTVQQPHGLITATLTSVTHTHTHTFVLQLERVLSPGETSRDDRISPWGRCK